MENLKVKNIRGFYPARGWNPKPALKYGETSFGIYAGYADSGSFYSAFFATIVVNNNPPYAANTRIWRCCGVKVMPDVSQGGLLRRE
jgi:hypothetical protein